MTTAPAPKRRRRLLNRDLLLIALPAAVLIIAAFALTLALMRRAPPTELIMSTGAADGSHHTHAMRYRELLARDGVTPTLRRSAGAAEHLQRLSDLDRLTALTGKVIAVGQENSGTAALAKPMLESNGITQSPTTIMQVGGRAAANPLLAGELDAAFFMADADAPIVQELLRATGIRLMSFARADAYVRQIFIETSLAYSDNLYVFRQHIHLVRQRAQARLRSVAWVSPLESAPGRSA